MNEGSRDAQRYLDLVRDLPRPTREQSDAFAQFVTGAHSWYKHLPSYPPGAPFTFFLDPNAGRALVRTPTGESAFVDRDDERDRFHYTWMFTREYRDRFGCWHYHTGYGTRLLMGSPRKGWSEVGPHAELLGPDGEWFAVPTSLARAGTCSLTSMVHEHLSPPITFHPRFERARDAFEAWSRRSPDDPDVQRYLPLLEIARAFDAGEDERPTTASAEKVGVVRRLQEFHDRERSRQRDLIRATLRSFLVALDA